MAVRIAVLLLPLLTAAGALRAGAQPAPGAGAATARTDRVAARAPRDRARLGTSLSGGVASREALVRAFLAALAIHDTVALRRIVVTRAEFADVYYPHSPYARSSTRQPVGLLWDMVQLNSEKGIVRSLRRLGGRELSLVALRCPSGARAVGASRLHEGCVTDYREGRVGLVTSRRLFGTIIQHRGSFKFISYANDM